MSDNKLTCTDEMIDLVKDGRAFGNSRSDSGNLIRRLTEAVEALLTKLAEVERELRVGDAVECVAENIDERWRDDWISWRGFLAGISVGPSGVANYTVSDHWPPKSNGDLTDGFSASQLQGASDDQ